MRDIKFYVIGLLFFGLSTISSAQEDKKVTLGLTMSPSVSWLSPANPGYTYDGTRIGFRYGLLSDFRLFGVDNYSLASGITMNHISGKLIEPSTFKDSGGNILAAKDESTYSMTYIDVPFALRLKTNEIGYNVFYAVFGSEFGFNLNAKKKYSTSYANGNTGEFTDDVSGEINLFRTSLVLGIGIQRNISGNTNYRIGLTYHNGLTNVMESDAYAVDGNGNTLIENNAGVYDKKLNTKLRFLELNFEITF